MIDRIQRAIFSACGWQREPEDEDYRDAAESALFAVKETCSVLEWRRISAGMTIKSDQQYVLHDENGTAVVATYDLETDRWVTLEHDSYHRDAFTHYADLTIPEGNL